MLKELLLSVCTADPPVVYTLRVTARGKLNRSLWFEIIRCIKSWQPVQRLFEVFLPGFLLDEASIAFGLAAAAWRSKGLISVSSLINRSPR